MIVHSTQNKISDKQIINRYESKLEKVGEDQAEAGREKRRALTKSLARGRISNDDYKSTDYIGK